MPARAPTLILLAAALLLLLGGGAAAQADTTPVTIAVGHKAVFTINAPAGCKVSVTVHTEGDHAFDPEVIKPQAKKGNKTQHVITCKGLKPGVSTFRYDYTATAPCGDAGGFLYEITVVNDPAAAEKAWAKRLKELLKELRGDLKDIAGPAVKDINAAAKQVKKGEVDDVDDFLGARFDKVQCDREALLAAALAALQIASDEGTDTLRDLDIPDVDKGPDFSPGGCGAWDAFVKATNDAMDQADDKIVKADMKFTKAFNDLADLGFLSSTIVPLPSVDHVPPSGEGVDGFDDDLEAQARFDAAIAALQAHVVPLPSADPGAASDVTVRVCILRPESVGADPGILNPLEVDLHTPLGGSVPVPLDPQAGHKQIGQAGIEQLGFLAVLREALDEVALATAQCHPLGAPTGDEFLDPISFLQ